MASSYFPILAAIFILTLFTTHPNLSTEARKILSSETDTEFIKTSCGSTIYPDFCFTTFSTYANEIQSSPKVLAFKSLSLTLNATRSAKKSLSELSKSKGSALNPKAAAALKDCVEQMGDSVDQLKDSIGEMDETSGKSFAFRMSDIQTWVSAALTNEDTCMDGFSETAAADDDDIKATVKSKVEKIVHMTSISLAFINRYASGNGTRN